MAFLKENAFPWNFCYYTVTWTCSHDYLHCCWPGLYLTTSLPANLAAKPVYTWLLLYLLTSLLICVGLKLTTCEYLLTEHLAPITLFSSPHYVQEGNKQRHISTTHVKCLRFGQAGGGVNCRTHFGLLFLHVTINSFKRSFFNHVCKQVWWGRN